MASFNLVNLFYLEILTILRDKLENDKTLTKRKLNISAITNYHIHVNNIPISLSHLNIII